MERSRVLASIMLSISFIALAAAIAYFSYAIVKVVDEAPALITQSQEAAKVIDSVVDEVEKITALVPAIIDEVALVREQIPTILAEVEALRLQVPGILSEMEKTRNAIPPILTEVEQVRLSIPPIVEEVGAVREELPSILKEAEGYRLLIPDVLAEVEATRIMVPETMLQAQMLVADASVAGKEASEGAVTGFFTGIIKAPLKLVSGARGSVFGSSTKLTDKDLEILKNSASYVINQNVIGKTNTWSNPASGLSGKNTLLREFTRGDSVCRVVRLEAAKNNKALETVERTTCLDADGVWVVADT